MKTNLLKNLKWALLSVALFVTAAMYAEAGFHETDAVKVKFDVNGSSQEKSLILQLLKLVMYITAHQRMAIMLRQMVVSES